MYKISIDTSKGQYINELFVADPVCVIGKKPENKVVLHGWGIGREHARIKLENGAVYIEDLGSRSGTRVNGNRIDQYGPINESDVIEVGQYRLKVADRRRQSGRRATDVQMPVKSQESPVQSLQPSVEHDRESSKSTPTPQASAAFASGGPTSDIQKPLNGGASVASIENTEAELPAGAMERDAELSEHAITMHEWRVRLRRNLHEQMDLRRIDVSSMSDVELRDLTNRLVLEALETQLKLPEEIDQDEIIEQVVAEAVGLGPLEPLISREDISEIMVNCAREVFYECAGRIYKSDVIFTDDQAVQSIIERIVAPVGRRIDESSPMVDARLKDGSRVNAVIPPLALKGPCVTIRKFMKERLTGEHLVNFGSISPAMVQFLDAAVRTKRNILISGGTGSGKTTLLNVLSNFIPVDERIVTIEDSAELRLYQPNLVSMEARPPNQEGSGAVTIRDLVRNALRMRPDRIVVGECRSGEALDMLQAMNTGHDGSLSTVHANSARDCLSRLEVMVMMSGMDLPITAIREQVASAVNLIVQQTRFPCGTRKVTGISEVVGMESDRIQLAEVFRYRQTGYDEQGRVQGQFEPTGLIPEFYEELSRRGVSLDLGIFQTDDDLMADNAGPQDLRQPGATRGGAA